MELGSQGPPADEIIERIAVALQADTSELLRAAGRAGGGASFEQAVLSRLDSLEREMRKLRTALNRGDA